MPSSAGVRPRTASAYSDGVSAASSKSPKSASSSSSSALSSFRRPGTFDATGRDDNTMLSYPAVAGSNTTGGVYRHVKTSAPEKPVGSSNFENPISEPSSPLTTSSWLFPALTR